LTENDSKSSSDDDDSDSDDYDSDAISEKHESNKGKNFGRKFGPERNSDSSGDGPFFDHIFVLCFLSATFFFTNLIKYLINTGPEFSSDIAGDGPDRLHIGNDMTETYVDELIEEMIAVHEHLTVEHDIIMAENYYYEEVYPEQIIREQLQINHELSINIEQLEEELANNEQTTEQYKNDLQILTTEYKLLQKKTDWVRNHLEFGPYLMHLTKDMYTSIIQKILDHLNKNDRLKNQKTHLTSSIDSIRHKHNVLSQQLSDLCLQNEQILVRLELAGHMQSYKRKRQSHDTTCEQPLKKNKIIDNQYNQYTREQLDIYINDYYDLRSIELYLQEQLWQQSEIQNDINDFNCNEIGEMEQQILYLETLLRQILRESLHNNEELKSDGIYVSEKNYMGLMDDIHFSVDENNQLQNQINSLQSELDELKKKESLFSTAREIILSEKMVIVTELYNYGWMDIIDSYLENGK
jgi:hypothetical protein